MPPKVSVIMSVYNGSCYLPEAIDSILNQTLTDFEFIIIDDCSSQEQVGKILDKYLQKDQRIKLIQNEKNIGLTQSLNKGIAVAQGQYIARMDADDLSLPDRLAIQTAYLEANPHLAIVASGVNIINEVGEKIETWLPSSNPIILKWHLTFRNIIRHPTVLWNRTLVQEKGGQYNPQFRYSQDYELWTRLLANDLKIGIVDQYLVSMRRHQKRITTENFTQQDELSLKVVTREVSSLLKGLKLSRNDIIALSGIPKMARYKKQGSDSLAKLSSQEAKRIYTLYFKLVDAFCKEQQIEKTLFSQERELIELIEEEIKIQMQVRLRQKQIFLASFLYRKYVILFPFRSGHLIRRFIQNIDISLVKMLIKKGVKKMLRKSSYPSH